MGRRALRKPRTPVDLSRHLRALEELPASCHAAALFGRSAPLEVEVGSGKGLFLRSAASAQPERDFLGVEVARNYAAFCAAALARLGLTNALVVSGDALRLFAERLPDATLAAVHVYFPDPWWKLRHRKRRVMCAAFVRDVERTLVPGGRLHFWTDVAEYFQSTLDLLAAETRLAGPLAVAEATPQHDLDYRTHFERRVRQHGETVYRSECVKPPAPVAPPPADVVAGDAAAASERSA